MSLQNAMIELADEMEKEIGDATDNKAIKALVKGFSRSLRLLSKMADMPTTPIAQAINPASLMMQMTPESQHRQMIEQAKSEFRKSHDKIEDDIDTTAVCVDGPEGGCSVCISTKMKPGMRTFVCNDLVYEMGDDGKLHFKGPKIELG